MATPKSRFFLGASKHGHHRVHYLEWGDEKNQNVVLMVHGLNRNCHDFDMVAAALSSTHRYVLSTLHLLTRPDISIYI
jgi:hypothetical protein